MNEELQRKLIEYLSKIEGGIERAVDFSAEQVPLVIQELIQWTIVEHTIYAATWGCLAMFFVMLLGLCIIRREKWDPEDPTFPVLFIGIPSFVCATLTGAQVVINGSVALKAYLAPRLFVLEYLKDLVN